MVRIKRGTTANKRRKKILKETKGYRWGRKSKYKQAKQAFIKAKTYAYRDRKVKKRDFRRLWQIRIGAACRRLGLSYSRFIHQLKEKNIEVDRKILNQLVQEKPEVFEKIVEEAKPMKEKTLDIKSAKKGEEIEKKKEK